MRGGPFYSASAAERKQPCCSVRFGRAEPEQPIGLLGRTEPSPSNRVMPPSKPNRACKPPSRARADPPLGLLGLIPGLGNSDDYEWGSATCEDLILAASRIRY